MKPPSVGFRNLTLFEGLLITFILGFFGLFFVWPIFAGPSVHKWPASCLSNVKQIGLCSLMYASDYDDHLPSSNRWMDQVTAYSRNEPLLHDYVGVGPGGYGYAFRASAGGVSTKKVAAEDKFVMLFDSTDTKRNAAGGLSLLPKPGRHYGKDTIGFADGHVRMVATDDDLFPYLVGDKSAGPK